MENSTIKDVNEMSVEEIQAILAEKTKKKKAEQERQREAYNKVKYDIVNNALMEGRMIEVALNTFHGKTKEDLETFREMMREYGEMKGNSKGGYSILNADGTGRVRYKFQNLGEYDERSDIAIEHINGFFKRSLKPVDEKMYNLMRGLLERQEGKLEYSRVAELLKFEDQYEDVDWKKGCQLLKESWVVTGTKYYIEVEERDENGKWRKLNLNLSSI